MDTVPIPKSDSGGGGIKRALKGALAAAAVIEDSDAFIRAYRYWVGWLIYAWSMI